LRGPFYAKKLFLREKLFYANFFQEKIFFFKIVGKKFGVKKLFDVKKTFLT